MFSATYWSGGVKTAFYEFIGASVRMTIFLEAVLCGCSIKWKCQKKKHLLYAECPTNNIKTESERAYYPPSETSVRIPSWLILNKSNMGTKVFFVVYLKIYLSNSTIHNAFIKDDKFIKKQIH